jgi:hypothetical protein
LPPVPGRHLLSAAPPANPAAMVSAFLPPRPARISQPKLARAMSSASADGTNHVLCAFMLQSIITFHKIKRPPPGTFPLDSAAR